MPHKTETLKNEHWDEIALRVYGSELLADWLMRNNPALADIYCFDAGVTVNTPIIPEENRNIPSWRQ